MDGTEAPGAWPQHCQSSDSETRPDISVEAGVDKPKGKKDRVCARTGQKRAKETALPAVEVFGFASSFADLQEQTQVPDLLKLMKAFETTGVQKETTEVILW